MLHVDRPVNGRGMLASILAPSFSFNSARARKSRDLTVASGMGRAAVAGVAASIADYIALSRLYQEQEHGHGAV
jgi:hypothetical protein